MRFAYKIASYGLLIGVIHTALTPVFYPKFNEVAMWFAGTGLALIFLSFLNLAAERLPERLLLNLTILANLLNLVFVSLIVMLLNAAPQAWITFILAFIVTIGSISLRMNAFARNSHKQTLIAN